MIENEELRKERNDLSGQVTRTAHEKEIQILELQKKYGQELAEIQKEHSAHIKRVLMQQRK